MPFTANPKLSSLALSPDYSLAAVGLKDGSIQLVDLQGMQVVATLSGHRGSVDHLAFSADGKLLASASADGTVQVWGISPQ
jgi:WD40 repeat protein